MAGVYRVTGRLDYRGHKQGEEFMANLAPTVERRAVDRGAIVLLERVVPALREGSYLLPEGWLDE
jgi:hypothetical protein